MKVKDVMVADVATCSTSDDLARAAQLMWEHDCGVVPVVEADDYLIGMFTDRDACMAAYTQGRPLNAIRVGDVMSRAVVSVHAEEDIGMALAALRDQRVRRVPVVNDLGRLVGIISLADLARRVSKPSTAPAKGLTRESVAETLASISQPWSAAAQAPALPKPARAKSGAVLRPQRAR